MPNITPQDYNGDALTGEQLFAALTMEIRDRLKGDMPEVLARALCSLKADIDAIKDAMAVKDVVGDAVARSTYKVPFLDENGELHWTGPAVDGDEHPELAWDMRTNTLNVNIGGSSGRAAGLTPGTMGSGSVYKLPVLGADGAAYWDAAPGTSGKDALNYDSSTNTINANITGRAASTDYIPPRMVAPTYLDISWDSVSWADFCGVGSNSLIQKVFGSSFSNLDQTTVVLGRMTHPPADWAANTGMDVNEFKFCTFIGIKTRDQVFVEFISNEKLASDYTQHKLTFMLNPNGTSGSCVLSISKSVVINKNGNSFAEGSGSSLQPVYVKSDGGTSACYYKTWPQVRGDGDFQSLEPRWYAASTSGHLPAMASGDVVYFRVDDDTTIGGRYSFAVMLQNLPCSISLRANLWSWGDYHVMVDERTGYPTNIYGGIVGVIVKGPSSSNGRYHLYIAVKANSAITANTKYWTLASSNPTANVTICTQAEYDADTLSAHEITLPSSTMLMSTDKWYYGNNPYAYGTGGDSSTPVYVDTNGHVKACTPSSMSVGSAGKLSASRTVYVALGTASTSTTFDWSTTSAIPVSGTLGVANGGTGKSSVTAGNFLVGNGTSALAEKTPAQVRSLIGAGTSDLAIGTTSSTAAAGDHQHGLTSGNNFTREVPNQSSDATWAYNIGTTNGSNTWWLKVLRMNANAPEWLCNNFATGIAFGGHDTKGVISISYNSGDGDRKVTFAGGNGSAPLWYGTIAFGANRNYILPNFGKAYIPGCSAGSGVGSASKPVYVDSNNEIKACSGYTTRNWTAVTKGQRWSRLCYVTGSNVTGTAFILNASCTRGNVVCNATFLITTTHDGNKDSSIVELGSTGYTQVRIRTVLSNYGNVYVELYDSAASIAQDTEQTWMCSLLPLRISSLDVYTTYTSGATIPSGYGAGNDFTTTKSVTGKALTANGQVGNANTPVYVDSNNQIQACNTPLRIESVNSIPSQPETGVLYAL